ncbi:hypothetical protein HUW46_09354 [Amycolatopsis sp. CA-230715]|nr:hypothetical protein HUW46_09354 [Amycolatopsis sp. CA-230715]
MTIIHMIVRKCERGPNGESALPVPDMEYAFGVKAVCRSRSGVAA